MVITGATVMRPGDEEPDDQAPDDAPVAPAAGLEQRNQPTGRPIPSFRPPPVNLHSQGGGAPASAQRQAPDMVPGGDGTCWVVPPQPPHPVVSIVAGRCPLRAGNCDNCGETSSPQWRRGPPSKPSLCNACGCRYKQSGETGLARISNRLGAGGAARASPQQAAQPPPVKAEPRAPPQPQFDQQNGGGDAPNAAQAPPPAPVWDPNVPVRQQHGVPPPFVGAREQQQQQQPQVFRDRPPPRMSSQGAVAATAALTGAPPRGQWMSRGAPEMPMPMPPATAGGTMLFTASLQAAVAAGEFEQQRMGWVNGRTGGGGSGGGRFGMPPGSSDSGADMFAPAPPRPQFTAPPPKRKEAPQQFAAAAPPAKAATFQKKKEDSGPYYPRGPEDLAAAEAEHHAMGLLPAPLAPDMVRCDCAHCEMPKLRKRCLRLLAADGCIGADVALGGAASCGLDVEVLWPRDDAFYLARVVSYDPGSRTHVLRYFIDGQRETRHLWTDILQWPSGTGAVSSPLNEQWTQGGSAPVGQVRYHPVGWLTVLRHRALAETATAEAVRRGTGAGVPAALAPALAPIPAAPATQATHAYGGAGWYTAPPPKRPKPAAAAPEFPSMMMDSPEDSPGGSGGGGGDGAMGAEGVDGGDPQAQLQSGKAVPPAAPRPRKTGLESAGPHVRVHKPPPPPLTDDELYMLRCYVLAMQQAAVPPPYEYWKALRRFCNKGLSREEMQREAQGKLQGGCRSLHGQLMALVTNGSIGYKASLAAMLAPMVESKQTCQRMTAEARAQLPVAAPGAAPEAAAEDAAPAAAPPEELMAEEPAPAPVEGGEV